MSFWDSALGSVTLMLLGLLGIVLLVAAVFWATQDLGMPSNIAQIEQVRHDAALVDPVQGERVIGQAVEWNQTIRSNQVNNSLWWAGWAVSDQWDSIKLIPVARP